MKRFSSLFLPLVQVSGPDTLVSLLFSPQWSAAPTDGGGGGGGGSDGLSFEFQFPRLIGVRLRPPVAPRRGGGRRRFSESFLVRPLSPNSHLSSV